MTLRRFGLVLVILLSWLFGTRIAMPALAEEIWFVPPDNLPRGGQVTGLPDFPRLFENDAQWRLAASRINVFGLTPYYVLRAPEAELRRILGFLGSHRISLNVALQALPVENCGEAVEGLVKTVREPIGVAQRLRELGANVSSFSFDEPLEYGHVYSRRAACRYSVQEVAQRLSQTVQGVRAIYPNAKFVDYETPLDLPPAEWNATLAEWLQAYRAATGRPLDGLAMDFDFRKPWFGPVRQSTQILHANGVRAGVFLDAAGGPGVTDESWMTATRQNMLEVIRARLPLDFVIVATWMHHPSRALPENDPLALTSLIDWYVEHRGR